MIKFFRKIRYQLLGEGKTGKYLKYAIGEIVLVMVGILLALQVNNWNEDRKLDNIELELLNDIKTNLIKSKKELENDLEFNSMTIQTYRDLLDHIEKDLPYSAALDTSFALLSYWDSPFFTYSAYESLKSKGLDIVKNDSIKDLIVELYESDFAYLVNDIDRAEWQFSNTITVPYFTKNILMKVNKNRVTLARPNNFEELKKSEEFHNLVGGLLHGRTRGLTQYEDTLKKTNYLIELIDKELFERL